MPISYLRGVVVPEFGGDDPSRVSVIVESGDGAVGHLVTVSAWTRQAIAAATLVGFDHGVARLAVLGIVEIRSETSVRLVGFADQRERRLFDVLVDVQGVGASKAVALLSIPPAERAAQIAAGDVGALTEVPGIGAKLATTIILGPEPKAGAKRRGGAAGPCAKLVERWLAEDAW